MGFQEKGVDPKTEAQPLSKLKPLVNNSFEGLNR